MPRHSLKHRVLKHLTDLQSKRHLQAVMREALLGDSSSEDSVSSFKLDDVRFLEDVNDLVLNDVISDISKRRYLFRPINYRNRRTTFYWKDCLDDNSVRFSEVEFLAHFRMSRSAFWVIHDLIKYHEVFLQQNNHRQQYPVELQLLVFLKRLGSEGVEGNNTKVASFFGIGKGSVDNYVNRVRKAVLSMKADIIRWPDAEERARIKKEIKINYGFQQCIGIIDGTIIVLCQKPSYYGESYFCRKQCYAVNVQVVCDHKGRIIYLVGGWPGSMHDNRAWRNCKVFNNAKEYFSITLGEYLLGDCAYSACRFIVQSFKKIAGQANLPASKEFFNTQVGKVRVKSEHCIGILKNRFPALRRCNIHIRSQKDIKRLLQIVDCAAILHNILVDVGDKIPAEYYDEIDAVHYWTSEYDGGADVHSNGDPDFDRRDEVFNAILHNNGFAVVE